MKFVSGEKNDSMVLRRRLRAPLSDDVESRLLSRRDTRPATFSFVVARTDAGITMSSSSASTVRSCFSTWSSSSSSSSLMLMKLRGRLIDMRRRLGERPSRAASASERFRWRVLTEATERNDGETLSDVVAAGALEGSSTMSMMLSQVSGGVSSTGENVKYERASPGDRIGDDCRGGERMAGSELVERWNEPTPSEDELASEKHAESVRVRLDGRRRTRGPGTSGRVVEGAGLGEGRFNVSREPRRSMEEEARRLRTMVSAEGINNTRGYCTYGMGAAADAVEGTRKGAYVGADLDGMWIRTCLYDNHGGQ